MGIVFNENLRDKNYFSYFFGIPQSGATHSLQHSTIQELSTKIDLASTKKIFAIVRNPFQKLVSEFLFLSPDAHSGNLEQVRGKFTEFVEKICNGSLSCDNHEKRQYEFLVGTSGEIDKRIQIYRFENLKAIFPYLVCHNKTESRYAYKDFYTEKSKALALEYYRKDFELFGYSMEL